MRTLGRKLGPLGLAPVDALLDCRSVPAATGAGRAFSGAPPGPVTGVDAPDAAVGIALSEAIGPVPPVPEEDSDRPEPGAIWFVPLSNRPDDAPLEGAT